MRAFESATDVELILAVDNTAVDYDYRVEAAKEIYRRAGVESGAGRIQQTQK